jgi:hypothetical protein
MHKICYRRAVRQLQLSSEKHYVKGRKGTSGSCYTLEGLGVVRGESQTYLEKYGKMVLCTFWRWIVTTNGIL